MRWGREALSRNVTGWYERILVFGYPNSQFDQVLLLAVKPPQYQHPTPHEWAITRKVEKWRCSRPRTILLLKFSSATNLIMTFFVPAGAPARPLG